MLKAKVVRVSSGCLLIRVFPIFEKYTHTHTHTQSFIHVARYLTFRKTIESSAWSKILERRPGLL